MRRERIHAQPDDPRAPEHLCEDVIPPESDPELQAALETDKLLADDSWRDRWRRWRARLRGKRLQRRYRRAGG